MTMAEITAAQVKELRDRTAAGMMDCKNALKECEGNIEAAIDWLRQKGLSKAAKKAGRATSEGVVSSVVDTGNQKAAIVEVMCETDFVSRGDTFQAFAKSVGKTVFDKTPADAGALAALLGDEVKNQIATLGENISVGRFAVYSVTGAGIIGCYVHANGKIGVLVELGCGKTETVANPKFRELAHNIAMQIAAACPAAVNPEALDPALVEREKEISRQKTLEEGKPANIVEKIVEGRVRKFFEEVCLIHQTYIRDDAKSVQALLAEEGKAMGDILGVRRFTRLQLGEGGPEE